MNVENKLKKIIVEIKSSLVSNDSNPIEKLSQDDDFVRLLEFDSLDIVNLSMLINNTFNIDFGTSGEDIESLNTFGNLVQNITEKLSEQ